MSRYSPYDLEEEDTYSRAYEEGFKDGEQLGKDNADIEWRQDILESDSKWRDREEKLIEEIISLLESHQIWKLNTTFWWEQLRLTIRELPNNLRELE